MKIKLQIAVWFVLPLLFIVLATAHRSQLGTAAYTQAPLVDAVTLGSLLVLSLFVAHLVVVIRCFLAQDWRQGGLRFAWAAFTLAAWGCGTAIDNATVIWRT